MKSYSKDALPPEKKFRSYRKRTLTKAARIKGPFSVQTTEGVLTCEDGWLAIDARGYPYPIAADEFDLIYETADSAEEPDMEPPKIYKLKSGPRIYRLDDAKTGRPLKSAKGYLYLHEDGYHVRLRWNGTSGRAVR